MNDYVRTIANTKNATKTCSIAVYLQQLRLGLGVEVGRNSLLFFLEGALHPQHVGGRTVLRDPRLHLVRVERPVWASEHNVVLW